MKKDVDEITIKYEIIRKTKIRIFGSLFIENNRNFCTVIFEGQEYKLEKYFYLSQSKVVKGILKELEIKLKGISKVTSMENMFYDCKNL